MNIKLIFIIQKALLNLFYYLFKILFSFILQKKRNTETWILGVEDPANVLNHILHAIPNSKSALIYQSRFYSYKNETLHKIFGKVISFRLLVGVVAPIYLALLTVRYKKFIYIGGSGFLTNLIDGRYYEFRFLKRSNSVLVCYFVGSDIRSPKKSLEKSLKLNRDSIASFQPWILPSFLNDEYELLKAKLAYSADQFANKVFNHELDQPGYLRSYQIPLVYFLPDWKFRKNIEKFHSISKIRVLHCPSSPVIKGTQVIRTVIRQLSQKGFDFEYVELSNVPNSIIMSELSKSHIVINELYSEALGIFALEGLSTYNCVLTSADPEVDPSAVRSSYKPWVSVQPENLYENLSYLLSNPEKIQFYADQGFEWASKFATTAYATSIFSQNLKDF
jgi:hypothetical protein